jgi:pre-mRNA-splicing factor SPF27
MASEIFDSLPYYDDDLQKFPALKAKVQEEIARELKESQTLHPRVPPAVELFAVRELLSSFYFASDVDHSHRIMPF